MSILKRLGYRILDGLVLGIAIAIPFTVISHYLTIKLMELPISKIEQSKELPNYGLILSDLRIEKNQNKIYVIGQIENPQDMEHRRVHLEAEFYNDKQEFVEKCNGVLAGNLDAGDKRNFRIRCDEESFLYESYTVTVIDVSRY